MKKIIIIFIVVISIIFMALLRIEVTTEYVKFDDDFIPFLAEERKIETFKRLIAQNPGMPRKKYFPNKQNPIDVALNYNRPDVASLLVSSGADWEDAISSMKFSEKEDQLQFIDILEQVFRSNLETIQKQKKEWHLEK